MYVVRGPECFCRSRKTKFGGVKHFASAERAPAARSTRWMAGEDTTRSHQGYPHRTADRRRTQHRYMTDSDMKKVDSSALRSAGPRT